MIEIGTDFTGVCSNYKCSKDDHSSADILVSIDAGFKKPSHQSSVISHHTSTSIPNTLSLLIQRPFVKSGIC